jgi:hypothetical protein
MGAEAGGEGVGGGEVGEDVELDLVREGEEPVTEACTAEME